MIFVLFLNFCFKSEHILKFLIEFFIYDMLHEIFILSNKNSDSNILNISNINYNYNNHFMNKRFFLINICLTF